MTLLQQLRRKLQFSMQEMAEHCGLARQSWRDLEMGHRLPSARLTQQLESQHGPIPSQFDTFSAVEQRLWVPISPYSLSPVNPEPWQRALRNWAYPISHLKLDTRTLEWMTRMLPSESSLESCGLFQLASLKARPLLHNPHQLAYREHPIVDNLGKALGERCLAALCGQHEGLRFILWPQVNLRPGSVTFRTDGLLWLRFGPKCAWCILEFDGLGHNTDKDQYRAKILGHREIRLSHREVTQFQVAKLFQQEARKILNAIP